MGMALRDVAATVSEQWSQNASKVLKMQVDSG
jgi:hypothetical protein